MQLTAVELKMKCSYTHVKRVKQLWKKDFFIGEKVLFQAEPSCGLEMTNSNGTKEWNFRYNQNHCMINLTINYDQ